MKERTNINEYSYEELIELEKKMKLKIERYNIRLEAIAKQKRVQKKKEAHELKQLAKEEKQKVKQAKLIDNTFDMELNETQVLDIANIEDTKEDMYKVSIDRESKRDRDLENAKEERLKNEVKKKNISVTSVFEGSVNEFDEEPKGKNKNRTLIIISIVVFMLLSGTVYGYYFYKDTYREIVDFENQELLEVENWAMSNGVEIIRTYEYSDTIAEYSVINQSIKAGEVINRKDVKLEVTISLGPDLKKGLEIDEETFKGMNFDEIVNWLNDNFVENYEFEFILDDEIEAEYFISFLTENLLTDANLPEFNRSQNFVFQISLGSDSDDLVDATIIDFSDMSKGEIDLWLVKRRLIPKFLYDFSSEIEKNAVIEQDVAPDTTVSVGTTITITLSLGEGIEVPNLTNMTLDEISEFAKDKKISIRQILRYSSSIEKNDVISQDIAVGSRVRENSTIEIVVSLGKVQVPNFRSENMRIDAIEAWIRSVNSFHADLNVTFKEDWNNLSKNSIISQDKVGFVNNGSTITVTVSKGPAVDIPNFKDQDEDDVIAFEESHTITIARNYIYDHEAAGQVVDHSQSKVGKHPAGTTMDISISKGQVPIEDFTGKYKSYVQSYIDTVNSSGANITLKIVYIPTVGGENNKFISQSEPAKSYNPGLELTVYFEKVAVIIDDFEKQSKSEAETFCEENFLECRFVDGYSPVDGDYKAVYEVGTIIENTKIGNTVAWGSDEVITFTVSVGKTPEIKVLIDTFYDLTSTTYDQTKKAILKDIAEQLQDHGFSISSDASYETVKSFIPGLIIEATDTVSSGQIDTTKSSDPSGLTSRYNIQDSILFYIGQD